MKARIGANAGSLCPARFTLLSLALIAVMAGLSQAQGEEGPVAEPSAGAGGIPAWNLPFEPASEGLVTSLQKFLLDTDRGKEALKEAPSLGFILRLRPDLESHRRIVGALGLSKTYGNALGDAVKSGDEYKALRYAKEEIVGAWRRNDFEGKVVQAVNARADQVLLSINRMSPDDSNAARDELEPFTQPTAPSLNKMPYLKKAEAAVNALNKKGEGKTEELEQQIAAALAIKDKDIVFAVPGSDAASEIKTGTMRAMAVSLKPSGTFASQAEDALVPVESVRGSERADLADDLQAGTISFASLERLMSGYKNASKALSRGKVPEQDPDVVLLDFLNNKRFMARGILDAKEVLARGGFKDVEVYLKDESGRKVLLFSSRDFNPPMEMSNEEYMKTLPRGQLVSINLIVAAPPIHGMNSSPFEVQSMDAYDGHRWMPVELGPYKPEIPSRLRRAREIAIQVETIRAEVARIDARISKDTGPRTLSGFLFGAGLNFAVFGFFFFLIYSHLLPLVLGVGGVVAMVVSRWIVSRKGPKK